MVVYQEYPPCAALAPYLACLWSCRVAPEGKPLSHRVLPDNCIDILWQDLAPQGGVAGMMSTVIHIPVDKPVRTLAVRFKPGAAAHFFALPLHELADLHPALPELWDPGTARRYADALWSRPLSDRAAIATLERLLLATLCERGGPRRTGLAEAAVKAIEAANGALRIESLARSLGVSRQHLASQFRARVGLGAKQFARVCRFRHASAQIHAAVPGQVDWAGLALGAGYYDQPHLIHEFRELAGSTPESFLTLP